MPQDLLAEVVALRSRVAGFDASAITGLAAMDAAKQFAGLAKAATAAATRCAARADETAAPRAKGFGDGADFLAKVSGQSPGQAKAALDIDADLDDLPSTAAAVAEGEISLEQAREIARTEQKVPGTEAEMLDLARTEGMRSLRDAGLRKRMDAVDPEQLREKQKAARKGSHRDDRELGMKVIEVFLPPEEGVPFINRWEAETDRLHRAARRGGDTTTTWAQHAADAFLSLFNGEGSGKGRTDLVIVADLNALRRGEAVDDEAVHVVGGGPVPVSYVREVIEADPFVKLVLHDGVQVQAVKHLGRKKLSAEVLTALQIGFPPLFEGPKCSFPGCTRTAHLEKDHVQAVTNGGPTCLANSQWLCWYHHTQKTERDLGRAPP